jgi:hypothetical protein
MNKLALVLILTGIATLPSCVTFDPALEFGHSADLMVRNGIAYERGAIDIAAGQTIVIPDDAVVQRSGTEERIYVYLVKQLGFMGHPTEFMSVRASARKMGCVTRSDGNALLIATLGEWNSIEGGAAISLFVRVPDSVTVEKREMLSGESSIGRDRRDLTKVAPAEGWTLMPTVPDRSRTAKR